MAQLTESWTLIWLSTNPTNNQHCKMQKGSQRKDNSSNFHWKQLQRTKKNDPNFINDDIAHKALILNCSLIPGQPHRGGLPVEPRARHGQQEQLHPDLLRTREYLQPYGVRHQSLTSPKYDHSWLLIPWCFPWRVSFVPQPVKMSSPPGDTDKTGLRGCSFVML